MTGRDSGSEEDRSEGEAGGPSQARGRGRSKDNEKRRRVLEAARSLFFARGFEGTSMDDIAIEAGVSKTTIYSNFGDKASLFREVVTDEPSGPPGPPPDAPDRSAEITDLEGLRASLLVTGFALVGMLSSPELHERFRLLIGHSTRDTKMADLFYTSAPEFMQKNVASLLESATSRGDLSVPEPMVAADQLLSMWMGLHNLRQQLGLAGPRTDREIERHVVACVEMFLRAYSVDHER